MAKRQVISAERLVVGDIITGDVGPHGAVTSKAQPRRVTSIGPEWPGVTHSLNVGSTTLTGRNAAVRVFDRDEQVEIKVQR